MQHPSCSSEIHGNMAPIVTYTRPSRQRKRRLRTTEEYGESPPKLTMEAIHSEGYVSHVAERFSTKSEKDLQASTESNCNVKDIQLRLLRCRSLCNVHSFSCEVAMCGRSFSNIEVLAYHMSYAHHDVSRRTAATTCLVCGTQLDSAKGKIAHMACRHRKLAAEHNSQCLDQREPVLAPMAPAALRLQQQREDERIIYEQNAIPDICDLVVMPHPADRL